MTNYLVAVAVMLLLGAGVALGLLAAAPERSVRQSLSERMASGAASLMMRGVAAGYAARTGEDALAEGRPALLHVTFRAEGDLDAFARRMDGFAPFLSNVPGLVWKVWTLDPATRAGSGTYLFRSEAAARMYLTDILPEGMGNVPYIADMEASIAPVLVGPSRVTRALD